MEQKRFPIFAERFNQLRRLMTQGEFADFLGISRPTVGFYENGTRIPDALLLRQIADVCEVSVDWLVGLSDDQKRKPTAIDELGLSSKAVEVLKKHSPITHYSDKAVFDYLLTHDKFENVIKAITSIMFYDEQAKRGVYDISKKKGIHPFSVLRGLVPEEYKESIDKMLDCFGPGSGIIGGKDMIAFQAFAAKMAFDSILESLIDEVSQKANDQAKR